MRDTAIKADALVVGAGVQGCVTALKLAAEGLRVLLVESNSDVLTGSSGNIEGWLHHGTYHAALANTPTQAMDTSQHCIAGAYWFREHCADSIHPMRSIALTATKVPEALEARWRESGVQFSPIEHLSAVQPFVALDEVTAAYYAQDVAISVPHLRLQLRRLLREKAVRVRTQTSIRRLRADTFALRGENSLKEVLVQVPIVIVTAGPRTEATLRLLHISHNLEFRLWRSHLLVLPVSEPSPPLFFVDFDKPSVFPQKGLSLMGLNSDNQTVESEYDPPTRGLHQRFRESLAKHFPGLHKGQDLGLRTCYKIDIGSPDAPRTVDMAVEQLDDHVWLQLPGKLTTAPVCADILVAELSGQDRLGVPRT